MPFNPNPFTKFQLKLLESIRSKLVEIRNPEKEVLDDRHFEFYLENTKKFGPIPKIRFKPNALDIKYEIMKEAGYGPVRNKSSYKARRNGAASAFDKHWDALMAGLIKSAKRIALFNQMFASDGQEVSDTIRLVQRCIEPKKIEDKIHNQNKRKVIEESYIDELKNI